MEKYRYLVLPDNERIPLLCQQKDKKPQFCKQFLELWELLANTGKTDLPFYSGTVVSFPVPNKLISNLIGRQELVDPTSIVRIYSFVNEDLLGPVTNNGYELDLYNDQVSYKISWQVEFITNVSRDFLIGFYRSDGYVNEVTNKLSLISGNRGASLFNKRSGSFIFTGVTNLYIACNKDVTLQLQVKVIIPDKITYPLITKDNPYIKFITVKNSYGDKIRLPVYKIYIPGNKDSIQLIKKPSKYFRKVAYIIQQYLRATGLSVTLLPDDSIINNKITPRETCSTCFNFSCNSNVILTSEYHPSLDVVTTGSVTTDTANVCNRVYWIGQTSYGIGFDKAPKDKVIKVKYRINTGAFDLVSYVATVKLQYFVAITPWTHNKLNNKGEIDGYAESITVPNYGPNRPAILTGEFRISETATGVIITVYYNANEDTVEADRWLSIDRLVKGTRFEEIIITYEDKVIP